jgi:hypothetical protein
MASLISRLGNLFKPEPVKPTQEQGVAGFAVYGGYVHEQFDDPNLFGWKRWKTASDMLASVSVIAASIRFMSNLIARPAWSWEPADDSAAAQEAADFMQSVIDDMDVSWARVVRRSVMYKFHGFMAQEWIAMKRDDGTIGLRSIEPRPQKTITKWDVDESGQIRGIVQTDPQTGAELYLPRGKLLYLVDDTISDRPDGMGWFHHLYEPAQHLKSLLDLEKIGFERDLRGIPIGRAPFSEINKMVRDGKLTEAQGNAMLNDLRDFVSIQRKSNETGMVFDSMPYESISETGKSITSVMKWGVDLLSGDPQSVEEMGAAIQRLQYEICVIMGTENLMTGRDGGGSMALSQDKSRNLYLTANSILGDIAEGVERDIRDAIWKLNGFAEELKPKARVEDVAFKDAVQIAQVLADMATAGAILAPDDPAIDDLRQLLGISDSKPMDAGAAAAMQAAMEGKPAPNEEPEDPEGGGGQDPAGGARKRGVYDSTDSTEKFDPNQPRAPEGAKNGGQWVAGGSGSGQAPNGNGAESGNAPADRGKDREDGRRDFDEERRRRGGDGSAWAYEGRSPASDLGLRGVKTSYEPTAAMSALAESTGLKAPVMHELNPTSENASAFESAIQSAKSASPYGAAVYVYPKTDYEGMRLFVTEDMKSGFAIKSDGDIVSAFSDGGGKVHPMLSLAVENGGTKLDAFDTVLPQLYAVNGFKEVGRDKWDDQYKPDDWDYDRFGKFNGGRPDVVYMEYDPAYSAYSNTRKYDPNQPRNPAGTPTGGRWSSSDGVGSQPPSAAFSEEWGEGNFNAAAVARSMPDGLLETREDGVEIWKQGESFQARFDNKVIADMEISWRGPYATSVSVGEGWQRKGIATSLYDSAEQTIGQRMIPSPLGLSDSAQGFWKQRLQRYSADERQDVLERAVAIGENSKIGRSARQRMSELGYVEKFDPNQPRAPQGSSNGGQWVSAGGSGAAEEGTAEGEGADRGEVRPLKSGDKDKLIEALNGKTAEEMVAMGEVNQEELREIGRRLESELGLTFVDPGPKTLTRVKEKLRDEGYEGAHQITDYSRSTFVVNSPEDAEAVVNALARDSVVYDKGWQMLKGTNYLDRKLFIKHDNGGLSEVQLVPKGLAIYKGGPGMPRSRSALSGVGHKLYDIYRQKSTPQPLRQRVERMQARLYTRALQGSAFLSVVGGVLPPELGGN